MSRFFLFIFIFFLSPTLAFSEVSTVQVNSINQTAEVPWIEKQAFDRQFALGAYALNWSGSYSAVGIGLRGRWEPFELLGVDFYSEHLLVEDDSGFRHDHPIGFSLYVPIELFDNFRVRPLFGMCVVFSFTETENAGVERIDDILFGLHAGIGIEHSFGRFFSIYLETQVTGYLGHDRYNSPGSWSVRVGDSLDTSVIFSNALGFQIHL